VAGLVADGLLDARAAMMGAAAYPLYLQKSFSPLSLNAKPGLFL